MANRVLKSVLTGLAAALAAGVLALLAGFVFTAVQLWWAMRSESAGSAGIGAVAVAIPGLRTVIAIPLGFALGFYWRFRRGSREK